MNIEHLRKNETKTFAISDLQGRNYIEVISDIIKIIAPDSYLEIGGSDIDIATATDCPTILVGPAYSCSDTPLTPRPILGLYRIKPDLFFSSYCANAILGRKVDVSVVRDLHYHEDLLGIFAAIEKASVPNALVILHNCIPVESAIADRSPPHTVEVPHRAGWWVGDAWKAVAALRHVRPDLRISALDANPSGLVLITNLNPAKGEDWTDNARDYASTLSGDQDGLGRYIDDLAIEPVAHLQGVLDRGLYLGHRFFAEPAVLPRDVSDSNDVVILSEFQVPAERRPPPDFIEGHFVSDFDFDGFLNRNIPQHAQYLIEARDSILFGERAVVTPAGRLITDVGATPPFTKIFEGRFHLEFEHMNIPGSENQIYWSPSIDTPASSRESEGALLSSSEHWNYGAWLLRIIPKILILRELGFANIPIIAPAIDDWQKNIIYYTAGRDAKVITHDRMTPLHLDRLLVPSQRFHAFYIDEETRKLYDSMAERATAARPLSNLVPHLVYVSRFSQGLTRPNYRRCLNEQQLIDRLAELGFLIFEPEKHSFEEQIAIFRHARLVVGASGAGMFNTVFCQPGTSILAIEPLPIWIEQHANIYASMQHRYGFVIGGSDLSDDTPVQKRWIADIPTIMACVERMIDGLT